MFSMLLSKLHYTINVIEIWKGGHDFGISIVHGYGLVLLCAESIVQLEYWYKTLMTTL